MSSTIIDETVILRYLLDDDEVLSPRAAKVIATRTARVYPEIVSTPKSSRASWSRCATSIRFPALRLLQP